MSKNLKLSYILLFVFSAVIVAWNTLKNFFGGIAINFVALIGIMFVLLLLVFTDKDIVKRIKDLLIIAGVFCLLEFVVYFIIEFNLASVKGEQGMFGFQCVLSLIALFAFFYMAFRFICEIKNIKFDFIETMLGNKKRKPSQKKAKELSNGSLEDKPNNKVVESETIEEKKPNEETNTGSSESTETEDVVIVETEE